MSWFYDALKRVEQEAAAAPGNAHSGTAVEGSDAGPSFLASLEFNNSIVHPRSTPQLELLVAEKDRRAVNPSPLASPDGTSGLTSFSSVSPNGYRRLSIAKREDSRLVFHTDPHGLAAEHYRLLRRNLIQEFPNNAVLMITSPGEGDGKSLTALNLATCLAETESPTLLVELDIRRPTLRKVLGSHIEGPGVEDALSGKVPAYQSVCYVEDLSLYVALVVQTPRDPSKLVNGEKVREFISGARQRFRWTIVDSPPTVPAADVADLLGLTDGVLLVVRAQRTPKDLTKRALELLGPRLHSIVFNGTTVQSNPYYRHLSHYYHSSK
jgi:protein-tyrosine kinase